MAGTITAVSGAISSLWLLVGMNATINADGTMSATISLDSNLSATLTAISGISGTLQLAVDKYLTLALIEVVPDTSGVLDFSSLATGEALLEVAGQGTINVSSLATGEALLEVAGQGTINLSPEA